MKCVIIEDEAEAADGLERKLNQTGYSVLVQARLDSIEEAVPWLKENHTDLIFLDIQLGDGLAFEIFDHIRITTPVIFMTSFDQYMERAFEVNSLSYLLKPVNSDKLKSALDKYHLLMEQSIFINQRVAKLADDFQQRFLVKSGNSYISIPVGDVAYFFLQNKTLLFLVTRSRNQYLYDSTLESLESRLDPNLFFRINRQCIVAFDVIRLIHYEEQTRRFILETDPKSREELIVSRHRTNGFKAWLNR